MTAAEADAEEDVVAPYAVMVRKSNNDVIAASPTFETYGEAKEWADEWNAENPGFFARITIYDGKHIAECRGPADWDRARTNMVRR